MFNSVSRVLKLSGQFAGKIRLAFFFSFLESICKNVSIMMVLYTLVKASRGTLARSDIWLAFGVLLGYLVLQIIFKYVFLRLQSGSGTRICTKERLEIGDLFKKFSMGYFTKGNLGKVSTVITQDLNFFEENAMPIIDKVINSFISAFLGVGFIFFLNFRLGQIALLTVIFALLALRKVGKVGDKEGAARQAQQEKLTTAVLEYSMGISVIKAFNIAGEKARALVENIRKTRDGSIKMEKKIVPIGTVYLSIFGIGIGLISLVSADMLGKDLITVQNMVMALIFSFSVFLPLQTLMSTSIILSIMDASLNRYEDVKNEKLIDENLADKKIEKFDIEFKNVSFSYDESEVLNDISFISRENTMTALVGHSGSGKTTIANLIVKFWNIDEGQILIGGEDTSEITTDSLLENISMVFQRVYLFSGSIRDNILFGRLDATEEEMIEASKLARCHDFIMNLPAGYDTPVEEGGKSLSGGERQRISVARAILKNAPIVILDEATSSVDPDNEKHIQDAINELVKNKTLIVIAHRLSTIKNADQILVLDGGKIAERGTHDDLVKKEGVYKKLLDKRTKARGWKVTKGA